MILAGHYPPPTDVMVTNVSSKEVTFRWNSVTPMCNSSIQYLVNASNCGICPRNVTNTVVTCYGFQPSTEIRKCRFSVQSVVCGVVGNSSDTISESIGGMYQVIVVTCAYTNYSLLI